MKPDVTDLVGLFQSPATLPCVKDHTPGRPFCPRDTAEGTPIPVFRTDKAGTLEVPGVAYALVFGRYR